jgi:hypothetical protein
MNPKNRQLEQAVILAMLLLASGCAGSAPAGKRSMEEHLPADRLHEAIEP